MNSPYSRFKYFPAGDSAVLVVVGNAIHPNIHRAVRGFLRALEASPIMGVRELVPAYCSVSVLYDPGQLLYHQVVEALHAREKHLETVDIPEPRVVAIPVAYGGEEGPDLEFVAQHARLSVDEVIALHSSSQYFVYMLGFTPGFCYLGGLDTRLRTPRRAEPRVKIPAGSVGIAGQQTGVYPIESPGGWQVIGRTPLKLFDPRRDPPVLIQAGDVVQFVPIQP
jgi:KipI family sensor histidine kinase inhibitor